MTGAEQVAPLVGATVLLPCGCPAGLVRDTRLHQDDCPRGPFGQVHDAPYGPRFEWDDGGRAAAGYRGSAGDCAARAFAIATGEPYREVYDWINHFADEERTGKRKRGRSNARLGVYRHTAERIAAMYGGVWTPCSGIGTGTLIHVRPDELPATGRHVLRLSKHFAAYVDGVLRDTHDCSRSGTRAVYGYWTFGSGD